MFSKLQDEVPPFSFDEVKELVQFYRNSTRGVC